MQQVLKGPEARCAIELYRTDIEVIVAQLDSGNTVAVKSYPLTWKEIGEHYRNGVAFFEFDKLWRPLTRNSSIGPEPYPVIEAARNFIRGMVIPTGGFTGGALTALAELLPHGDIHLFTREEGFIGRFCSVEDLTMIATALKVEQPIVFSSPEEFKGLTPVEQSVVLTYLDPERHWPGKFNKKQLHEVFDMAKKAKAKKGAKVEKAEAKQRKADGPVANARKIFDKMRDKDTGDIIAACVAAGVNKGTATTQLGRWRKEQGIVVKRGGARVKGAEAAPEAPAKKPEAQPKTKKKKAATKAPSPEVKNKDDALKAHAAKEAAEAAAKKTATPTTSSEDPAPDVADPAPADTTASAPPPGSTATSAEVIGPGVGKPPF